MVVQCFSYGTHCHPLFRGQRDETGTCKQSAAVDRIVAGSSRTSSEGYFHAPNPPQTPQRVLEALEREIDPFRALFYPPHPVDAGSGGPAAGWPAELPAHPNLRSPLPQRAKQGDGMKQGTETMES